MKKWILFLSLVFLTNCNREKVAIYFSPEKASQYFKKIETICNKDGGKLWGKNLYGPLMFIDRPTRKIFANQPDRGGLLKKDKDGIYTGFYPKELIIDNVARDFGGTLFAIAPLPAEEDDYRITTRALSGLFYYFQGTLGIESKAFNTRHIDEKNARLWLKLEWKALGKAIKSGGEERLQPIRDALIFRGARRELYQLYSNEENKFENYEGLATFTYTLLATDSPEEYKTRLLEYLGRVYSFQSYARSYGFIHGALYAFLLHEKGFDFKTIVTDNMDLGNTVRELYGIQLPLICRDVAGSLALNYDVENIQKEEVQRLIDIKARIHKQISTFTEKPVVFLELESPYFDFEPENIHSLDTLGTLYTTMRVSDNWGKLTVEEGGCLVSNNFRYLRITAKGYKETKNRISGEGWNLILNSDWTIIKVDQNYFVRNLWPDF